MVRIKYAWCLFEKAKYEDISNNLKPPSGQLKKYKEGTIDVTDTKEFTDHENYPLTNKEIEELKKEQVFALGICEEGKNNWKWTSKPVKIVQGNIIIKGELYYLDRAEHPPLPVVYTRKLAKERHLPWKPTIVAEFETHTTETKLGWNGSFTFKLNKQRADLKLNKLYVKGDPDVNAENGHNQLLSEALPVDLQPGDTKDGFKLVEKYEEPSPTVLKVKFLNKIEHFGSIDISVNIPGHVGPASLFNISENDLKLDHEYEIIIPSEADLSHMFIYFFDNKDHVERVIRIPNGYEIPSHYNRMNRIVETQNHIDRNQENRIEIYLKEPSEDETEIHVFFENRIEDFDLLSIYLHNEANGRGAPFAHLTEIPRSEIHQHIDHRTYVRLHNINLPISTAQSLVFEFIPDGRNHIESASQHGYALHTGDIHGGAYINLEPLIRDEPNEVTVCLKEAEENRTSIRIDLKNKIDDFDDLEVYVSDDTDCRHLYDSRTVSRHDAYKPILFTSHKGLFAIDMSIVKFLVFAFAKDGHLVSANLVDDAKKVSPTPSDLHPRFDQVDMIRGHNVAIIPVEGKIERNVENVIEVELKKSDDTTRILIAFKNKIENLTNVDIGLFSDHKCSTYICAVGKTKGQLHEHIEQDKYIVFTAKDGDISKTEAIAVRVSTKNTPTEINTVKNAKKIWPDKCDLNVRFGKVEIEKGYNVPIIDVKGKIDKGDSNTIEIEFEEKLDKGTIILKGKVVNHKDDPLPGPHTLQAYEDDGSNILEIGSPCFVPSGKNIFEIKFEYEKGKTCKISEIRSIRDPGISTNNAKGGFEIICPPDKDEITKEDILVKEKGVGQKISGRILNADACKGLENARGDELCELSIYPNIGANKLLNKDDDRIKLYPIIDGKYGKPEIKCKYDDTTGVFSFDDVPAGIYYIMVHYRTGLWFHHTEKPFGRGGDHPEQKPNRVQYIHLKDEPHENVCVAIKETKRVDKNLNIFLTFASTSAINLDDGSTLEVTDGQYREILQLKDFESSGGAYLVYKGSHRLASFRRDNFKIKLITKSKKIFKHVVVCEGRYDPSNTSNRIPTTIKPLLASFTLAKAGDYTVVLNIDEPIEKYIIRGRALDYNKCYAENLQHVNGIDLCNKTKYKDIGYAHLDYRKLILLKHDPSGDKAVMYGKVTDKEWGRFEFHDVPADGSKYRVAIKTDDGEFYHDTAPFGRGGDSPKQQSNKVVKYFPLNNHHNNVCVGIRTKLVKKNFTIRIGFADTSSLELDENTTLVISDDRGQTIELPRDRFHDGQDFIYCEAHELSELSFEGENFQCYLKSEQHVITEATIYQGEYQPGKGTKANIKSGKGTFSVSEPGDYLIHIMVKKVIQETKDTFNFYIVRSRGGKRDIRDLNKARNPFVAEKDINKLKDPSNPGKKLIGKDSHFIIQARVEDFALQKDEHPYYPIKLYLKQFNSFREMQFNNNYPDNQAEFTRLDAEWTWSINPREDSTFNRTTLCVEVPFKEKANERFGQVAVHIFPPHDVKPGMYTFGMTASKVSQNKESTKMGKDYFSLKITGEEKQRPPKDVGKQERAIKKFAASISEKADEYQKLLTLLEKYRETVANLHREAQTKRFAAVTTSVHIQRDKVFQKDLHRIRIFAKKFDPILADLHKDLEDGLDTYVNYLGEDVYRGFMKDPMFNGFNSIDAKYHALLQDIGAQINQIKFSFKVAADLFKGAIGGEEEERLSKDLVLVFNETNALGTDLQQLKRLFENLNNLAN